MSNQHDPRSGAAQAAGTAAGAPAPGGTSGAGTAGGAPDPAPRLQDQEPSEPPHLAQSLLLSRISHELLTPLNSLIGFPELLLDGQFGPLNDPQRQAVGHILGAGEQLRRL